ncbi:MAG: type II/IV secretion system protein [Verrucomicrobia bacterium]|nr:MAG: type II/IV secretion system protein [Verrucomicrobiota bacterium]
MEAVFKYKGIEEAVRRIVDEGIENGTSDIHWERQPGEGLVIRYRLDGELEKVELAEEFFEGIKVISHIKILSRMNIDEKRMPQDGRMSWSYKDKKYDIRVSSLPTVNGENLVLRILDREDLNLDIKELGFCDTEWEIVEMLLKKANGLVLVTGPTGSGKTTTLYSALNFRSQFHDKIVTVEDPIEYEFNHFAQIPVRTQIGMTFGNALRAILRQSPNTIMIGEIRDKETAQIAINAALTGHLVLSTLHANDALSVMDRLKDFGLEIYQIAAALQGVIAQKLVRRLCEFCKEKYVPTDEALASLGFINENTEESVFYTAKGCKKCRQTGFRGRLALFEILPITQELREVMGTGLNPIELKNNAKNLKWFCMKEHGRKRVLQGLTTIDEILANVMSN